MQEKHVEDAGWLSLAFEEPGAGRTIMPNTVQSDFAAYVLEFIATGTNTAVFPQITRTNSNLSEPILLNVGIWDLYITAFLDEEKNKPAAYGEIKGIVINSGGASSKNIILDPIVDGIGTGTFSWNITYPSNVTDAVINITRLPINLGNDVKTIKIDDASTNNSFVELNSGFYRVEMKLSNNDGFYTERWETLHIYQNINSFFSFAFEDSHFNHNIINNEDFGLSEVSNTFNVSNITEWNSAVNAIAGGGNNKNYIINIIGNISIAGRIDGSSNFGSVSGIIISLRGTGNIISLFNNGIMLRIGSNQKIILRDLILQGRSNNTHGLIWVDGGTFVMRSGKITGNGNDYTTDAYFARGGGVHINNGIFSMYGGEISGNSDFIGGGVTGHTFIMHGGRITGNSGRDSSGVNVLHFTMYGGEINGNTGSSSGGVSISRTFDMYDGKIFDNTATNGSGGGVYFYGSHFNMYGGEIFGNTAANRGGGVCFSGSGSFNMYGGKIFDNTAIRDGGGMYFSGSHFFNMYGGEIFCNTAVDGGGVNFVGDGSFNMYDGVIFGNTAANRGGGVYVSGINLIFRINGGIIYGSNESINTRNTAESDASIFLSSNIGTAQYGRFNGNTWISNGNLSSTNNTIKVVDGVLMSDPSTATYTVSYNINGGSGTIPSVQIVNAGNNVTLASGSGLTRNGFTFSGWNTNSSGTGTNYNAGSSFAPSNNIILYAKWDDTSYPSGHVFNVANVTQWDEAINGIALGGNNKTYTINITADFNVGDDYYSGFGKVSNITVTIQGNRIITRTINPKYSSYFLLHISAGHNVILQDTKLRGGGMPNGKGIVLVDGGTFTMQGSAAVYNQIGLEPGVFVVNGGTFIMKDNSSINNIIGYNDTGLGINGGGGVKIFYSTFIMQDNASIHSNTGYQGAAVYLNGGTFSMHGSTSIYGNKTTWNDAWADGGGGVYIAHGTFIKTGGTIYGNNEGTNSNTSITNRGHAVYDASSSIHRWRNSTANTSMNTNSSGFWEGSF